VATGYDRQSETGQVKTVAMAGETGLVGHADLAVRIVGKHSLLVLATWTRW
jgi:hypothetical protein